MTAEPLRLSVPEPLDAEGYSRLRRVVAEQGLGQVLVLACGPMPDFGVLEAARLLRLIAEARAGGLEVRLENLSDAARQALADVDPAILEAEAPETRPHPLEWVGLKTIEAAETVGAIGLLARDTAAGLAKPFGRRGIQWGRTLQQMVLVGSSAVPIVAFISVLIGVVLALNGAQQLRQFGAAIFIANLVGISMTREMGPLVTAVIVSGRTGSAIAAEIGTMMVSEEIDAMRTMALSPVRFLVVPKVLALALMMPLLTVISITAGIFGGYVIGVAMLDLGSSAYLSQTVQSLFVSDVVTGLVKSVVFALIIGLVGAHRGFSVRGGPEAVGAATTSAVVTAIVLSIVANAGFTAFFYYTE